MRVDGSNISCGIIELTIGNNPNKNKFDKAMRNSWDDAAIILASLNTKQKKAIKFVKSVGFKKVGRKVRNPNSGNEILLFRREITNKDRKKWGWGVYHSDDYFNI